MAAFWVEFLVVHIFSWRVAPSKKFPCYSTTLTASVSYQFSYNDGNFE
jgi:hypothetical protein